MNAKLGFPIALVLAAAVVGAGVAAILTNVVTFTAPAGLETALPPSRARVLEGAVVFEPRAPTTRPRISAMP